MASELHELLQMNVSHVGDWTADGSASARLASVRMPLTGVEAEDTKLRSSVFVKVIHDMSAFPLGGRSSTTSPPLVHHDSKNAVAQRSPDYRRPRCPWTR